MPFIFPWACACPGTGEALAQVGSPWQLWAGELEALMHTVSPGRSGWLWLIPEKLRGIVPGNPSPLEWHRNDVSF